ncbi:MAG: HRDC domain-containing protein [Thermoplasmata archaeon]|nr:MAG: HRDC domain-containing protein [Thermoplasmata archaeon]
MNAAIETMQIENTKIKPDELTFEEEIALKILECIQSLKIPIGRTKLAGILVGSLANYIFDRGYNTSPYFGTLNVFSRQQVVDMIDSLIIEGCISFGGDEYPLLVITGLGKAVLEGAKKVSVTLPWELEGKPVPPPSDKNLFKKLRYWRRDQAKKEELPAFCIIHNKTLFELSEKKPNELDELYDVFGLSTVKVEKYGDMILNVIQADTP